MNEWVSETLRMQLAKELLGVERKMRGQKRERQSQGYAGVKWNATVTGSSIFLTTGR